MISNILENDFLEHNDFSNQLLDPIERATLESNYIQLSITSFKYIRSRNYQKAQEGYKECLNIAEQLKDDFKKKDSICNIAVSLFYCGKIKEAIDNLENAHKSYNSTRNNILDSRQDHLYLKIISNLTIAYLSYNKPNEALMTSKGLLDFINKESNAHQQHTLMKSILYNFFRLESIVNIDDSIINSRIQIEDSIGNNQEVHKKIIKKIIYSFYSYLQKNDLSIWINTLTEEIDNLKELKDYNGLIFAIFNQQCGIYGKNSPSSKNTSNTQQEQSNSNIQGAKAKILALTKALTGDKDFEEKNVEKILICVKEKMNVAVQIYQMLYNKEKDILSKLRNNQSSFNSSTNKDTRNSSSFFIKHLLKYSLNYINANIYDETLKIQMKNQIELTIKLIDSKEIDLSNLKLNEINPQIAKSINLLFINLLDIYNKSKLRKYLCRYKLVVSKLKSNERNKRINNFNKLQYTLIEKGDTLLKINLTSSGQNEHFYRVHFDTETLQIFKKRNNNSPSSQLPFDLIKKILFGISSSNLKKKINNTNEFPWLFMSIIYKDKSIDLSFTEDQINRWFYGLYYFLYQTRREYKIISTHGYILSKLRMKMINEMVNSNKSNREGDLKSKYSLKTLADDYNNNTRKNTFVKVLILYKKMNFL